MGWKSTIALTRSQCIDQILEAINNISSMKDEQLAEVLEEVLGGEDHGYNYMIVDESFLEED